MKLNPEVKQLRKDLRLATKIISKQTNELKNYRLRLVNQRKSYFNIFIKPIFEIGLFTQREQRILEMRFGFIDGESKTYEDTCKIFDVSRDRIRQIECKAIEKLYWFGRNYSFDHKK